MILVQKPPPSQSPLYAHRRHPSAPNVVVLPTRTPGLLTLSKPSRPPLQRQTLKPLPKLKSTSASLLNLPAEITDNKSEVTALPKTPLPQQPGRIQVEHKPTKGRVQNQRWFSFGGLVVIWVDNTLYRSNPSSPSPPSRKSANHKQDTPSSLVPEAIPVPNATQRQAPNISRSNPLPPQVRRRRRPISALPSTSQHFPICNDMNDIGDLRVPTTPPPTRRDHDSDLQTAIIPFNTMGLPSSPSPPASKRKHRRTPSEDVFHMSSDEDLSSGSDGTILNPNVQALFGLVNNNLKPSSKMLPSAFSTPTRLTPPFEGDSASASPSYSSKCEASEKAAGYFASSMFQNSPSPEELPDPPAFWVFFY